ncbi:hypothetical protein BD560DRAFT_381702 [Blakeslea trispora]|nr:hypothetical protein BD560DRAFT_381702 [Blakeslea trispora]
MIEIGLRDKGQWATKELNETNSKRFLVLASMLQVLSSACSLVDKKKLYTVGFVVSASHLLATNNPTHSRC